MGGHMAQEKVEATPRYPAGGAALISRPLRRTGAPNVAAPLPFAYQVAKRTLDIIVSLGILLTLSPLLLLATILIRATSPGPAIYRQRRVGENGRIFTMYKFRSMYHNADHRLHRQAYQAFLRGDAGNGKVDKAALAHIAPEAMRWHLPDERLRSPLGSLWRRIALALTPEDPRITLVGALIRRTSIDELPQLFNVLIGDMTLVGPRPPIPYEVRLYSRRHLGRLAVRPGVTGVWQVYGRGRVAFEHMVDMDLEYIVQRSFWLDLRLLALTIPTVIFTHGAR
jgi:lipopolysaccharide/colanic/teichoic acid biosynthesis glycosyltransferase